MQDYTKKILPLLELQRKYIKEKKSQSLDNRIEHLKKLRIGIVKHSDKIVEAVSSDLGKGSMKVLYGEIDQALHEIDLFCKKLKKWASPKKVRSSMLFFPAKSYILPEPRGHCLIISPWNYPFNLALLPLIGSIACGNSVVLKPSEISIHTSHIINQIISETLPPEVAIVVEGAIEETSFLLSQKFDHIFYTGNKTVGQIVLEKAAAHLTPVVLELGGKSPAVVMTKNISLAAKRIVWGKFFNCGQTCIAPDYVLVSEKDYSEFVFSAIHWIKEFYPDIKSSEDYGSIINERQFKRLENLLSQDVEIIYGGERDQVSKFFSPTLLRAKENSKIMEDEIFGPLLPIVTVQGIDEAIELILSKDKPLACYPFIDSSTDKEKIKKMISSGAMVFNDTLIHADNSELPFGGIGESGMGSYHGHHSFVAFSHFKPVIERSYSFENSLRYPPFGKKIALIRFLAKFLR
jgi:aldehyde dehydrogenase (NAD+)